MSPGAAGTANPAEGRERSRASASYATHGGFCVSELNAHYEGQYTPKQVEWRRLGALDKAQNIAEILGERRPVNVLEVGCGTGAVLGELSSRGIGRAYRGVDMADPNQHRDVDGIALDVFDGDALPYGDGAYDFVYATHVLEHVYHPRRLLEEMARVSSNLVYVEVPCELHLRTSVRSLQRTLDIGHINALTPESFQLLVESSGLKVIELRLFDHSLEVHRWLTSPAKASVKRSFRSTVLKINPKLASALFTYHCGALCDVSSDRT